MAQGDQSKYITVNVPFSLETIPEKIEEYHGSNNFAGLMLYLDLEEDLKTAC